MRKYIFVFLSLLTLSSCGIDPLKIANDDAALKKPTLQWQAPPKQILAPVVWDFPRMADQEVVKNTTKCLKEGKRGILYPAGKLPEKCAVPAIDNGSNLYIGLTESNYRNLVNNYNIFILRETRWKMLLDSINKIERSKSPAK